MMQRLNLLIIVFSFSILNVNAQADTLVIERQFMDYSSLIIAKDYEKALDYTNEEFFKIIPKDQMITLLKRTLNSNEMEFIPHLPIISDFQNTKNINGKIYVKFISSSTLEMKEKENEESKGQTEKDRKLKLSLYKLSFENTFGVNNVKYNEQTKYFEVKTAKKVIASSDDKMKNWKFVIVENERQKKLLERFIPKELMD